MQQRRRHQARQCKHPKSSRQSRECPHRQRDPAQPQGRHRTQHPKHCKKARPDSQKPPNGCHHAPPVSHIAPTSKPPGRQCPGTARQPRQPPVFALHQACVNRRSHLARPLSKEAKFKTSSNVTASRNHLRQTLYYFLTNGQLGLASTFPNQSHHARVGLVLGTRNY